MSSRVIGVPDIESAPLGDGGVVLFQPASGKFVMLNRSAATIWTELAEPRTEAELAQKLCEAFPEVSPATAEQDGREAIEELRSLQLISELD